VVVGAVTVVEEVNVMVVAGNVYVPGVRVVRKGPAGLADGEMVTVL